MTMRVSFTGRKCDGMLGRWMARLICVYCVHFQNCIMTNLQIKRKLDFLKDYVRNWSGTGLMSKYYSILGNFHIHKEVKQALNIVLRKSKETRKMTRRNKNAPQDMEGASHQPVAQNHHCLRELTWRAVKPKASNSMVKLKLQKWPLAQGPKSDGFCVFPWRGCIATDPML